MTHGLHPGLTVVYSYQERRPSLFAPVAIPQRKEPRTFGVTQGLAGDRDLFLFPNRDSTHIRKNGGR